MHKERNLLAYALKHLHDEIKADFNDMVHAKTAEEVLAKRKLFLAKWKLRCRAVADSLEEAGKRLFTFLSYPPEQWRSLRSTNAIERLHEEFKRRIKTQCLLPLRRDRGDAALGAPRLRSDHHAPGRWLADPGAATHQP